MKGRTNMEYENSILLEHDELNLSDFALFLSVMKNRDAYECTLSIIMDEQDLKLAEVKVEEVVLNRFRKRAIRLDAWAVAADDRQFVTEMQNDTSSDDVRKRARYYQGLLDSPILKSGKSTRYKYLPSSVIIFITQEDIFGKDLAKYTFTEQCKELNGMDLEDGTKKIFLNMKSKNGAPELISLLQYMKQSNLNNPDIIVQDVKQSEEWEEVHMSIYGNGLQQGREEGRKEGRLSERKNLALEMLRDDEPLEKIMKYAKLTEEEIMALKKSCKTS